VSRLDHETLLLQVVDELIDVRGHDVRRAVPVGDDGRDDVRPGRVVDDDALPDAGRNAVRGEDLAAPRSRSTSPSSVTSA